MIENIIASIDTIEQYTQTEYKLFIEEFIFNSYYKIDGSL
jgi:hypothetical protein